MSSLKLNNKFILQYLIDKIRKCFGICLFSDKKYWSMLICYREFSGMRVNLITAKRRDIIIRTKIYKTSLNEVNNML